MPTNEQRKRQFWSGAWKTLNWKSRPDDHFEAYWYLLHKRSPRYVKWTRTGEAKEGAPDNNDDQEDGTEVGGRTPKTITCEICGQKDTFQHAYLTCPQILNIWQTATITLTKLTGIQDISNHPQLQFNFENVLFAFPDLRRNLPKNLKPRVLLWHSTILHLIWKTRQRDLAYIRMRLIIDENKWRQEFELSIRSTISEIFNEYKSKNLLAEFDKNCTRDCSIWGLDERQHLRFLESSLTTEDLQQES